MTAPARSLARLLLLVATPLAAVLFATPAMGVGGATRTWVSGVGDDINPCSRTAPCKTFAGAISKTADGGEIDVLDPGGYGAVTITRPMTIDASGTQAGVLVAGTNGITVAAGATDTVILRNINFDGVGSGLAGVLIRSAKSVQITGSRFEGFVTAGVSLAGSTTNTTVLLQDDTFVNVGVGVNVVPGAAVKTSVLIDRSTVSGSTTGINVGARGTAWLRDSTIFGNGVGVATSGGGTLTSFGDSAIVGNTTNGKATSTAARVLLVVPTAAKVTTRRAASTRLGFVSTGPADVVATFRLGSKVIRTSKVKAHLGSNALSWKPGKARAGTYRVTLVATDVAGQTATAKVTVVVRA